MTRLSKVCDVHAARRPRSSRGATIKGDIQEHLFCSQATLPEIASRNDYYLSFAHAIRDKIMHRWIHTDDTYRRKVKRTVIYLSAEYLLGPQLGKNVAYFRIVEEICKAARDMGLDIREIIEHEEDPGLGSGGLGRLAACFLDSLATLQIPAVGHGIHYEFGMFKQQIRNKEQLEIADKWLHLGNPWEIARPEIEYQVKFGGRTEIYRDERGYYRTRWIPARVVKGIPYDTPIVGYDVNTVNILRLWQAAAQESFDFQAFNAGDYYRAVDQKVMSEYISKVLYPNDESVSGKQLRLEQQYFFVSCALQDMIKLCLRRDRRLDEFHCRYAVQLNDTHPAIAIPELMRILVDEHWLDWDKAWNITTSTFAYTNHTLLPEALEKWPVALLGQILPRHLEIIYEINGRFLEQIRIRYPGDKGKEARLSLIEEYPNKRVCMAHLACVGSHAINGVSGLHTELLKKTVLQDFHEVWPDKFYNITNGVTQRRFMLLANPDLSRLISDAIGDGWITNSEDLIKLEPLADDRGFQEAWKLTKLSNKRLLAERLRTKTGVNIAPDSLFDIQMKRIHEYKRQHLNVLHILTLYGRIKKGSMVDSIPRTFIFGGKASPTYSMAKLIIRLIASIAEIINKDPKAKELLRVVFLPEFNVKEGQHVYPAADLSEQISTAGKEASGTGNIKFAMNGALTIGTLDGANAEIRTAVGEENFFLFGLSAEEVSQRKAEGYRPREIYENTPELREIFDCLEGGEFSAGDRDMFRPLVRSLLEKDEYMLLADYDSYVHVQQRVSEAYREPSSWTRKSILNIARLGRFSSDRAIREYNEMIWRVKPVRVGMPADCPIAQQWSRRSVT